MRGSGMRGGMRGGGIVRKDYTLLRDGQAQQDLFGDAEAGERKKPATVWRLFGLAKEETCVLLLATVALFVGSLATVAVPKLAGNLIDVCINFSRQGDERDAKAKLDLMLYEILGILAVGGVANGIRAWLFNGAAERVMCRLRSRLFKSLIGQEIGFFDRIRTGELMNRLSEDTRLMKSAGTTSVSIAIRSAVVAIFGIVLMFMTSPLLSALTLCSLPIILVAFRTYSLLAKKYTREGLTASAEASTVAEECFGSIRTVRSFAKEQAACERYDKAINRTLSYGLKSARASGVFFGFNFTVATGAIVCVLWYGARQVVEGKLTAGELSSFVIYAMYVGANVGSIANVVSSLIQAVGASERVFELLDRLPTLPPAGSQKPRGSPAGGDLELRDVWFAYPARPDINVLKGINLHIQPGRKVALVGPSGGGKSTIVSLVERFYDPQAGAVYLDGVPLPAIHHQFLHQQISIVSQEPVLFADTIFYNIAFGMRRGEDSVSLAQVEEAAKVANAHDFICSFPQGYRTSVGERGVRLSGGQKQRVAIARAILTQPRVLLLDEATSALDAESEALVQEALDRIARDRTVLVIAHRLSTVQSASEVAVISDGTIAERGTHTELLAKGGVYALLVRRQLTAGAPSASTSLAAIAEQAVLSPEAITRGAVEHMVRQDTAAIVDDIMASVVGDMRTRSNSALNNRSTDPRAEILRQPSNNLIELQSPRASMDGEALGGGPSATGTSH
ncbi:hypothetical protein WJX72_005523 [[Myrmecia] bisecta]|uniref:Uncharacterized protein n=1 Tax=[Myrmecia] bisecta TaxID=41462 RepID=A0AAW1QQR0_9CHLO